MYNLLTNATALENIVLSMSISKSVEKSKKQFVNNTLVAEMAFTNETFRQITDGFINENLKALRKAVNNTDNQKEMLKKIRRKEILGLRRIDNFTAIEKNTWFHLGKRSPCCGRIESPTISICCFQDRW